MIKDFRNAGGAYKVMDSKGKTLGTYGGKRAAQRAAIEANRRYKGSGRYAFVVEGR